jgi:hypothetical protein
MNQFMKERAVVTRRIDESSAGRHVHGIRAWPVIGAEFMLAGQMKGRAIGPSGHDGFAGLAGFNLVRMCWLIGLGRGSPSHCSTLKAV